MNDAPALSVERVVKTYSTVRAVAQVSFDVRRGEVLGFLGPNGAGKTTTLRMIMGITLPDEGRITFEGRPHYDPARVGYLPEERGLYEDAGVIDVLVYFGRLRGMSARDARDSGTRWLERLGLGDRTRAKVNTLSKGNQQKVQLAGALLHAPALAVLDEPFSGLDPLNQELFITIISELRASGAAVLLSAHQLGLVERLCDRFYLISHGRGLLDGTLDDIRRAGTASRTQTLKLGLRSRAGSSSENAVTSAFARALPGSTPGVAKTPGGGMGVEVDWPEGQDLGPTLAELAREFVIERVELRPLSLHEIYVHAVGGDRAEHVAIVEDAHV